MGWFFLKINNTNIGIAIVTKLYETPEEAIKSILQKFFEDMWEDESETRHYRGGYKIEGYKIEEDERYNKGYIDGLYPIGNFRNPIYLTYEEMINKILKEKYLEIIDPETGNIDEYHLLEIEQ